MIEEHVIHFEYGEDIIDGTAYIIPGNKNEGYNIGYAVFIPNGCSNKTTLLMHSCNTGGNVPVKLSDAINIAKTSLYERPNSGTWISSSTKLPVLIPLVPRIQGYYTQAFGSQIYHNDPTPLINDQERRKDEETLSPVEIEEVIEYCKDIHYQVTYIINACKQFLFDKGIEVDDKIIVEGYSAGSKFANYFAALHPKLIKGIIAGGTSGLTILPLSELNGNELKFPLGVADIPDFDLDTFSQIPQYYYIGDSDYNDPAMPNSEFIKDESGEYILDEHNSRIPVRDDEGKVIPLLDEEGKATPRYKENYTQKEFEQIHELLGYDPQVRFDYNKELYEWLGISAKFIKMPGNHSTVTQQRVNGKNVVNEMIKSIVEEILEKELETQKKV